MHHCQFCVITLSYCSMVFAIELFASSVLPQYDFVFRHIVILQCFIVFCVIL